MKTIKLCLFLFFLPDLLAQQVLKENQSFFIGPSSFIIESTKQESGYFYSIVVNDSIRIADSTFNISDNRTHTFLVATNFENQMKWRLDIPKAIYSETIKSKEFIAHYIAFSDSSFTIGNKTIYNPGKRNSIGLMTIDSLGNQLDIFNLGHYFKDSVKSFLYFNGFASKENGNFLICGYQSGTVNLLGSLYYSDTSMSTFFTLELDQSGQLVDYKKQFRCLYPNLKISNSIENNGLMIFETSFDSLIIDNKHFQVFHYQDYAVNDLALIAIDKSNSTIAHYAVFSDSSSNGYSSTGSIRSIGQSILWAVNSGSANIHVNDSFYSFDSPQDQLIFVLDLQSFQPKRVYNIYAENSVLYDLDYFMDSGYILTIRNPGNYVYIGEEMFNFDGLSPTGFISIEPNKKPRLIYTVYGMGYSMKLNQLTNASMEFWINYFTPTSTLGLKSIELIRNPNFTHWARQSTHYTLTNYSGIDKETTNSFTLYPNPGGNQIQIKFLSFKQDERIHIYLYSSDGKCIKELDYEILDNQTMRIDLTGFDAGLYTIFMLSDSGILSSLFIKE